MSQCVCSGAQLKCSFGMAPSVLNVLPTGRVNNLAPCATIMDYKPMVNVMTFGICQSMANPTVAAATAAAMGALTPMPCVPMTVTPWTPGCPTVLIGSSPMLNKSSKLTCTWGGQIEIVSPMSQGVKTP